MKIIPTRTLEINTTVSEIKAPEPQKKTTQINTQKKLQLSKQQVKDIVENMQVLADNTLQTKMNFSVDKDTNNIIIKIIEKNGGNEKIIKQIPAEEMLELHKKMKELTGFFLNDNI